MLRRASESKKKKKKVAVRNWVGIFMNLFFSRFFLVFSVLVRVLSFFFFLSRKTKISRGVI